jgi:hypothetical protein
MLEALLEDVSAARLHELKTASSAEELVDRASKALIRADQTLREASHEQRSKLRGFSSEMLALAADQTFRLGHENEQFKRAVDEDARARAGLTDTLTRAGALVEQALFVLAKVCGNSDGTRRAVEAIRPPPQDGNGDQGAILAETLRRLARAGERVIQGGSIAVKNRAILYGLDGSYLESLTRMGSGLTELAGKVKGGGQVPAAQQALDQVHGITAFLVQQIDEAFAAAHKLDPAVPQLVPADPSGARPMPGVRVAFASTEATPPEMRILGTTIPAVARAPKDWK